MNKTIFFFNFLLVITAIVFNSTTTAKTFQTQTTRGKVVSIEKADKSEAGEIFATIFIEHPTKANSDEGKMYLFITKETKIYLQQGKARKKAQLSEIKKGDVVFAKLSDAPTIMIYPLRIAATEIVIERKSKRSKGK